MCETVQGDGAVARPGDLIVGDRPAQIFVDHSEWIETVARSIRAKTGLRVRYSHMEPHHRAAFVVRQKGDR